MSQTLRWQKSSFSAGDSDNDCLEIAATPTTLHLRESDTPATTLSPTRTALHALLAAVRSTTAPGPLRVKEPGAVMSRR